VAEELYERALSNELAKLMSDSPEITHTITRELEVKARWWRMLEDEFGSFSEYETALLLGLQVSGADSVSAQRSAGKLLSYRRGQDRFPLFQFNLDRGTVLPVIPELIALARSFGYSDSDLVLWMITKSSLFAAQDRPVDHLGNREELPMVAGHHFDTPF
jgi:hypothetical protein